MEKTCVVCGKVFVAERAGAKYCCKKCSNRSRYPRSLEDLRVNNKVVLDLYNSELTAKEISEKTGYCLSRIYTIWKKAGLQKRPTPLQRGVIDLRRQGKCAVEIRDELGIDAKQMIALIKKVKMPFTEDERKRSIELGTQKAVLRACGTEEERKAKEIKYISDHYPDWEYVSGYHGHGHMEVRHKACGRVIKKTAIAVRTGVSLDCPYCKSVIKKNRAQWYAMACADCETEKTERTSRYSQMRSRVCPECGCLFIACLNRKYCSEECSKTAQGRRARDKRLRRLKTKYDATITLQRVYEVDNGTCWLCGGKCDYNDYVKNADGSFNNAGKNYPTIDHVYPVSKGGSHTWDNVRLAHWYCNVLKGDTVITK